MTRKVNIPTTLKYSTSTSGKPDGITALSQTPTDDDDSIPLDSLLGSGYMLTRVEGKIGSPEKPLSDLGLISYRSYWKDVLLAYLCSRAGTTLSIKDISQEMAINSYDIVSTLQALGMMKYWKGKHIILKKQVSNNFGGTIFPGCKSRTIELFNYLRRTCRVKSCSGVRRTVQNCRP
nr:histone acetyltransferase KAT7-like [Aedes albopictus]